MTCIIASDHEMQAWRSLHRRLAWLFRPDVDWAHGNIIMQGIVHEPSKEMEELGMYRRSPQSRMLFQKLPRNGRIDRH
jgi:hypothetical protein